MPQPRALGDEGTDSRDFVSGSPAQRPARAGAIASYTATIAAARDAARAIRNNAVEERQAAETRRCVALLSVLLLDS